MVAEMSRIFYKFICIFKFIYLYINQKLILIFTNYCQYRIPLIMNIIFQLFFYFSSVEILVRHEISNHMDPIYTYSVFLPYAKYSCFFFLPELRTKLWWQIYFVDLFEQFYLHSSCFMTKIRNTFTKEAMRCRSIPVVKFFILIICLVQINILWSPRF